MTGFAAGGRAGGQGQAGQPAPQEAGAPAAAGMLLFQDGSTHRWITALDRDLDLVVTLDDATGAIYSALLVEQEGTVRASWG